MAVETRMRRKGGEFLISQIRPEDLFAPEDFSEEHQMIADTAERFVREELLPRLNEIEHQQFELTAGLLRKAGGLGLLAIEIPQQYGGLGLDKASSTLVFEKLGPVGSFAVAYGAHAGIGTLPIVYFGSEEQKSRYLPRLATGELVSAYALSEAESGSDALAAKCKALLHPDGDRWVVNGEKMWVTNGGIAGLFIVFAKVDGEDFSAFLVERDFPGVGLGPEEKKMGLKGSSTRTLQLQDVPVPLENLLGQRGKGHKIALNVLNMGRFKLGASCVGTARTALAEALTYTLERHQFGRPICEFGAIQEKLGEMAIRTWVGESMAYRTVGMIDRALNERDWDDSAQVLKGIEEYAVECSIVKVWSMEMLDFVVDEAVQIHGGNGYCQEYVVERYYRDSRINRIFEGTNEINRLLIPGMLLRRAQKGELPLIEASQRVFADLASLDLDPAPTNELGRQGLRVEQAKKAALLVAGLAVQKYGERVTDEQEVLLSVADMVMEVYGMESALMRLHRVTKSRPGREGFFGKMNSCYIQDAVERAHLWGKRVLAHLAEGDDQRVFLSALSRFCRSSPLPSIAYRRDIAATLLDRARAHLPPL